MTTSTPRRSALSLVAIGLGVLAVAAATASFIADPTWELRALALVLIVMGLALGRLAGRRPPPADPTQV